MSQKIQYRHSHANKEGKPLSLRYTIAYTFDKTEDGSLNITYGVAQCRKNDTFSRTEGRKIAATRLNKVFKGKIAPAINPVTGEHKVPMYGSMVVKDHVGLSVGKLVTQDFLSKRESTLNHEAKVYANTSQDSNLLGFGDLLALLSSDSSLLGSIRVL